LNLKRSTVQNSGLEVVLINTPPGNEGELGLAALPGREKEFLESFMKSVEYAKAANCSKIHIMAGNLPDESDETKKICKHVLIGNLKVASEILTAENMTGTIEPINKKISCPRYFYSTPEEAFSILQIVAKDNIMYQCDLYHLQIEKGNLSRFLENNIEKIGHIQIAQVPGRHEPDSDGEINYDFVFKVLKNSGREA
jgi:hydroxypyruvate isomerase